MAVVFYAGALVVFAFGAFGFNPGGISDHQLQALGLGLVVLGLMVGGVPLPRLRPPAR